ncbi:MAG: Tm-1-like ATP-binding domain-containing protein [Anaerolineales bacterium]|nr:Tm-1-like ATP-binding domain-containing protein [Anaerolineales bacterium]
MAKYIFLLGSLDTKGREIDYLRQRVQAEGGTPLVVDTGVLGSPTIPADIDRHRVAAVGGSSIAELIAANDKTRALLAMAKGASHILNEYLQRGELGGVLSIGGSRGTALSTRVMQSLPVGLPKLMVSTVASGANTFGTYVGAKDIAMMYSVADVQGLNILTRSIFNNAAAAIVAMSRSGGPVRRTTERVFTASILGVSTVLVSQIQSLLENENCEVIAFHAIGTGGKAMEELIAGGLVEGVFDVTLGEITQDHVQGMFSAGPNRMLAAGQRGIPQVAAPGGIDFIITGPVDSLPKHYRQRKIMQHTPSITLVRTSAEEMAAVGRLIAERLSNSKGKAAMIIPREGYGWFSMPGQPLHDPEADYAFYTAFKDYVAPHVQVIELDTHLNDPLVGETAVALMKDMLNHSTTRN